MHDQKIIHGDLRGVRFRIIWPPSCTPFTLSKVNILIDNDDNPRLTGFSMVMMASKQQTIVPPPRANGTLRWMSPEILCPERFGLKNSFPTVHSDVYALGMVIYEVLGGQVPFAAYKNIEVVLMVLSGERPERARGDAGKDFIDEIWEILELCWSQQLSGRPNAKHVLMRLDGKSSLWPPSEIGDDKDTDTDDEQSTASVEMKPGTGSDPGTGDTGDGLGTESGHGAFPLPHLKFATNSLPPSCK